ncbi:MAG: hypothetical protein JNK58_03505 [Phycisphaerae bacterium]|nr:hypothetical protein [Phycisphaerae bacterium]
MTAPHKHPIASATAALILVITACASEERVVSARGGLFDLPGAQSPVIDETRSDPAKQTAARNAAGPWDNVLRSFPGYEPPPDPDARNNPAREPLTPGEALGLRRKNPDGTFTLFARSPADVMYHVMTTLDKKEYDLLLDQVIAEETKAEYRRQGRDPREAINFLVQRRADIAALFATFPMGDQTPGVNLKTIGRNQFRLTAPVAMTQELKLHTLDVAIENGNFRLLMIR